MSWSLPAELLRLHSIKVLSTRQRRGVSGYEAWKKVRAEKIYYCHSPSLLEKGTTKKPTTG